MLAFERTTCLFLNRKETFFYPIICHRYYCYILLCSGRFLSIISFSMELLIIIFSSCGMNREQKMSNNLGDNDLFPIILCSSNNYKYGMVIEQSILYK